MHLVDRRIVLANAASFSAILGFGFSRPALAQSTAPTVDMWMKTWMDEALSKAPVGALHMMRFVEPIYVITNDIHWVPGPAESGRLSKVDVPKGFVTDLASIPRAFWSLLRPDGEYTYPAILHDWMYWRQDRPRAEADEIFFVSMREFGISVTTANTIYAAVATAGQSAWSDNAGLKKNGERRVLKQLPENPLMHWAEWKKRPDVFL